MDHVEVFVLVAVLPDAVGKESWKLILCAAVELVFNVDGERSCRWPSSPGRFAGVPFSARLLLCLFLFLELAGPGAFLSSSPLSELVEG